MLVNSYFRFNWIKRNCRWSKIEIIRIEWSTATYKMLFLSIKYIGSIIFQENVLIFGSVWQNCRGNVSDALEWIFFFAKMIYHLFKWIITNFVDLFCCLLSMILQNFTAKSCVELNKNGIIFVVLLLYEYKLLFLGKLFITCY